MHFVPVWLIESLYFILNVPLSIVLLYFSVPIWLILCNISWSNESSYSGKNEGPANIKMNRIAN